MVNEERRKDAVTNMKNDRNLFKIADVMHFAPFIHQITYISDTFFLVAVVWYGIRASQTEHHFFETHFFIEIHATDTLTTALFHSLHYNFCKSFNVVVVVVLRQFIRPKICSWFWKHFMGSFAMCESVCVVWKLMCVSDGVFFFEFVFIVSDSNTMEWREAGKKPSNTANETQWTLNTFQERTESKELCRKVRNVCISSSRLNIKETFQRYQNEKKIQKLNKKLQQRDVLVLFVCLVPTPLPCICVCMSTICVFHVRTFLLTVR